MKQHISEMTHYILVTTPEIHIKQAELHLYLSTACLVSNRFPRKSLLASTGRLVLNLNKRQKVPRYVPRHSNANH